MAENKKNADETDETSKTEGTKNEPTESTPEDTIVIDALIEEEPKTENIKARIRFTRKTLLVVVGIMLLAILSTYIFSFSNQKDANNLIINPGLIVFICGLIIAFIGACILLFESKKVPFAAIGLLWLIFVLPIAFFLIPLSKYHNQNCIERDKKIAEILQTTLEKDSIMIILPSKHISENGYLEKVLSVGWTNDKKTWKKIAIPCRRGNEHWYEATIDKLALDQTGKKAVFILFFDHAWKDYQVTKEVLLQPK